jgi:hypothetical protein
MKIGKKYIYFLKVSKAIDEAHLCGLLCGDAHVHFNPDCAPEKPPKKIKEPPTLPLPLDMENVK